MKTLATALATPLSLFIVSFSFRTALSVCRFRPPKTAPFSSAAVARPRISDLKPRPARRCQRFCPVPRPHFFRPQSRSDRACSLHRRAPTAAVSPKPATQTASVSAKPAICSRLLPSNPRSAPSFCAETQLLCPPFSLHQYSHLPPLQPYSHFCLLFTILFLAYFGFKEEKEKGSQSFYSSSKFFSFAKVDRTLLLLV